MADETRTLVQIEGVNAGQRVVLVGNGYTLQATDLDAIHAAGLDCFGMNGISGIFGRTAWRPRYYACVSTAVNDPVYEPVFRQGARAAELTFMCQDWLDLWRDIETVIPVYCVNGSEMPTGAWADTPMNGVCKWGTSMTAVAQIAAWMGYKTIYFIGMPGRYTGARHHFDGYPPAPNRYTDEDDRAQRKAHKYIAENLTRLAIEFYNISRDTVINAYPRKRLEEVIC